MAKKKKKQNKKLIYAVFGFIIFGFLLYLYTSFLNHKVQKMDSNPIQVEESTLNGLSQYLNANATPRDYEYDDWIMPDGKRVPLTGKQILLGTNGINGVGKYGNFTTDDLDKVNTQFVSNLQSQISNYFTSTGFSKNKKNTITIASDSNYYYSTYGYQMEDVYCLSHVAKQSDPFGYITCGTIDQKQAELQKQLNNVYLEQKKESSAPITFRVAQIDGDYASGSVSADGGWQWLAEKADGEWRTIWTGQDFPMCSDMEKYQVPSSLYPGCYNPATQQVQKAYNDSSPQGN
ncbi:MAG TPA: hypothetical protein VHE53_05750 [Patescibacteria group bacterium]|nr:hypothetical protein [Patescibacteria group bacterium]